MSHDSKMRTSVWVNGTRPKAESPEDMDTPLDFSSKKRRSPEVADDTASEGGGSSTSSCQRADSPPASMVAANGHLNPLLRFGAVANNIGNYLANNPAMPAFPFRPMLTTDQRSKSGNKPVRPFKAYPRDPLSLPLGLYGLPMNLGLSSASMLESFTPHMFTAKSKDLFAQYKNALQNGNTNGKKNDSSFSMTTSAAKSSRKATKQMDTFVSSSVKNPKTDSNASPNSMASGSPNAAVDSTASTTTSSPATAGTEHAASKTPEPELDGEGKGKKRARSVPDDVKDESYWERRRKNNEAAKRSRDARRVKEDDIAMRATLLEAENQQLRAQVMAMKNEIDKLHCMLLT